MPAIAGDSVPWETAIDRSKKRTGGDSVLEDPQQTNVTVLILQQASLFSNWWAAAEQKCSIGLAGRCVFGFAEAGEPGPPKMADFGADVVLPLVKEIYRTVLKTLGPHAPLPSQAALLSWNSGASAQDAVYRYRRRCHNMTKTLPVDETFASCLNKSGYWLSVVAFWNAVLAQIWPGIVGKEDAASVHPEICDDAVRLAMDFFTFRFLYGAGILSADLRRKTWQKSDKTHRMPPNARWSIPPALLLKASCGMCITPKTAARAGPMFSHLAENMEEKGAEIAGKVYLEALHYLVERGFGEMRACNGSKWPMFLKRRYSSLPESCKAQLAEIHVHPVSFGLHLPQEAEEADEAQACDPKCSQSEELARQHTDAAPMDVLSSEESGAPETTAEGASKPHQASQLQHDVSVERSKGAPQNGSLAQQQAVGSLQEKEPSTTEGGNAEEPERTSGQQQDYKIIFEGQPSRYLENFSALRDEVTAILGSQRDMGIYTFTDKGCKGTTRRLSACCKPAACEGCEVSVWAFLTVKGPEVELIVRSRGKHGKLASPAGGRLWTVAEECVLNQIPAEKLTTKFVREALGKAALSVRCTNTQLHDYLARERKKCAGVVAPVRKLTVGELKSSMGCFMVAEVEEWRRLPLHRLIVWPGAVADAERVCVVFTCPGMLAESRSSRKQGGEIGSRWQAKGRVKRLHHLDAIISSSE